MGRKPRAVLLGACRESHGFLGGAIGLRPTLFIAIIGSLIPALLLLLSPIIQLRTPQQAVEQYAIQ